MSVGVLVWTSLDGQMDTQMHACTVVSLTPTRLDKKSVQLKKTSQNLYRTPFSTTQIVHILHFSTKIKSLV